MTGLQNSLVKLVVVCQTMLGFAAARVDGDGDGDNQPELLIFTKL